MPATPLVSVITIFHDEERFLGEAVESVLAQSWTAWELLLCDDGSSDASSSIARDFAARYPDRIRYLEHQGHANRGMSATRNLGLDAAAGELISFLDGDDVWVPEKLTRQVELLLQHPTAAAVYGRLHIWHAWTRRPEDLARDYIQPLGVPADTLIQPPMLLRRFLEDDVHTPSGLLFRRNVLDAVGGYEESFRGMHEDGIVLAKICLDWPVYASGEVWYKYRQHPDSCCTREIAAGRDRDALRAYLEWIRGYLHGRGHEGTELEQLVVNLIRQNDRVEQDTAGVRIGSAVRTGIARGRRAAEQVVPAAVRGWVGLFTHGSRFRPPSGWVHMGNLRRTSPVSQFFGFDRGLPIDRYYIERFLRTHAGDIRGRVLEVGDATYTRTFGGDRVTRSDVLHARPGNPEATIVGDLATGAGVPEAAFDCIILTQVLPFVWDVPAAIATAARALRPGGVLLVTAPGISQISRHDADRWGDYWRFTSQSMRRLFEQSFDAGGVRVETHGNALAATAFLQGLATHELTPRELDDRHPDYEVIITVRACQS